MPILKELIESAAGATTAAATAGGDVAGFRGHFFANVKPTKVKKNKKKNKINILHRGPANSPAGFHYVGEGEDRLARLKAQRAELMDKSEAHAHNPKKLKNFDYMLKQVDKQIDDELNRRKKLKESYALKNYSFKTHLIEDITGSNEFDASDVIAKLKQAAKTAEERGSDTVAFALEDEDGAMVKVWVPDDQADDFQASLEQALSASDDDDDDENSNLEIAEVLWELRKDFDIINVEWGDIPEDQEEVLPADVEVEGDVEGDIEAQGDVEMGAEGEGEGEDMTAEPEDVGAAELGGETAATSTLQQVIDMMAQDAAARKAEAEARAAEAEAEKAKYAAQAAAEKVKQEEEILDMEAYEKAKKEEEDEAKRLARLAKFKHQVAADDGAALSSEDEMGEPPAAPAAPQMDVDIEAEVPMPEEDEEISKKGFGGDTMLSKAELGDLILRALRRR